VYAGQSCGYLQDYVFVFLFREHILDLPVIDESVQVIEEELIDYLIVLQVEYYLSHLDASSEEKLLQVILPVILVVVRIKLDRVVLIAGKGCGQATQGLLPRALDTDHDAVREGLLYDAQHFDDEFDHAIEEDHIDLLLLVELVIVKKEALQKANRLSPVKCLKVEPLRALVEVCEKWSPAIFRIHSVLSRVKVSLGNLSHLLVYLLSILFIAYPIAESPP
jgi:hypothetical protein